MSKPYTFSAGAARSALQGVVAELQPELARSVLAKWIWCRPAGSRILRRQPNLTMKGKLMKKHPLLKTLLAGAGFALLLGVTTAADGGVPSMNVTVFDPMRNVAFQGPIGPDATFATAKLPAGEFVVQFNSKSAAASGNQYLLVVSAGKKKVIAASVPGTTFAKGGAAMKIQVARGLKITGQVVNDQDTAQADGTKYRMIDGKRFVWISSQVGSNRGGHWSEASLAPALNITEWRKDDLQKRMDRGGEGSMIPHAYPTLVSSRGY